MLSPVSSNLSFAAFSGQKKVDTNTTASAPTDKPKTDTAKTPETNDSVNINLSAEQLKQLDKLKSRDKEVRSHEQAHLSAAGSYAIGGASFSFQSGPDGKRYAIGGEVSIDTSPIANDPKATLQKAEIIKRAALAPASPSDQDRRIAAQATKMAAQARSELQQTQFNSSNSKTGLYQQNTLPQEEKGSNINYSI